MNKIENNYRFIRGFLSELYWHLVSPQIWRFITNKPILVYQHGKVGSTAVYEGLKISGVKAFQLHTFARPKFKNIKKAIMTGVRGWKVITLCRDPIAVKISGFFQNIDNAQNGCYIGSQDEIRKMDWADLARIFLERLNLKENAVKEWPIRWFYDEFQSTFGVNIFELPFDKEKGFARYKLKNGEVLLIRYEDLEHQGVEAIKDFLELSKYQLAQSNVSENKYYAEQYKIFKDKIKLPETTVRAIYTSKEMKHFYTDKELRSFAARWKVSM